jgi:hypothetical protein
VADVGMGRQIVRAKPCSTRCVGIAIAIAVVRVVVIIDIVVVGKQRPVNPKWGGAAVGDRHVRKALRVGQYLRASGIDAAVTLCAVGVNAGRRAESNDQGRGGDKCAVSHIHVLHSLCLVRDLNRLNAQRRELVEIAQL